MSNCHTLPTHNHCTHLSPPFQNRYKNYAGISPRSVKCYWEQYNQHETDCQDEVYMRVAEDVTYKLWELGNVS